jgi:outer membrane protein OmpA-like peptidoglycan-associated protein
VHSLFAIAAWCVAGSARADGPASIDIELLRPSLAGPGFVGMDAPTVDFTHRLHVGAATWYEQDPLVVYENGVLVGNVVTSRQTLELGASYAIAPRVQVRGTLPVAAQWGGQSPEWSRDGVGLGDLAAGLRVEPLESRHAALGVGADILLPTGTRHAWTGDAYPRLRMALLGLIRGGPLAVGLDAGFEARTSVDTGADLAVGAALTAAAGVRFAPSSKWAALATVVGRGDAKPLLVDAGENAVEVLIGAEVRPTRTLVAQVAVGHGLTNGAGADDLRVLGSVTWTPPPKPPVIEPEEPPPVVVEVPDLPPEIPPPPPEPPPSWGPEELARVEAKQIELRDPVQFEVGTDRILPVSAPTLAAVAALLEADPQILHIAIVGHASEEGSFEYNYDLSVRRARAIFEALVTEGVHPDRLSFRGMGEVQPREGELAASRRVEFQIIRVQGPGETEPAWSTVEKLPWNGAPRPQAPATPVPPPPPVPQPPPTPEEP